MPSSFDVLAGYYDFGNFGDDLFRDTLMGALSQTSWAHPHVTQNQPGPYAKLTRNLRATRNLLRARSVTLGGGSILGARGKIGIRQTELAITAAKRIPYCAIGVGILEGLPKRPDRLISHMSWIGLRSEAEYFELSKSIPQAHYMSDIAYSTPKILGLSNFARSNNAEITIVPAGIGELGRHSGNLNWLNSWLKGNIVPLMHQATGVKLLRLQPENEQDMLATEQFDRTLKTLDIPCRTVAHHKSTETVQEIATSRFMFTDRLHGGILAHIGGVPFRLSKHYKKCHDVLLRLAIQTRPRHVPSHKKQQALISKIGAPISPQPLNATLNSLSTGYRGGLSICISASSE